MKKIEGLEKENKEMKKKMEEMTKVMAVIQISVKNLGDMWMKSSKITTMKTQYVVKKTDGSIKDADMEKEMVIDSGAPMSLVSAIWLEEYLKEMELDENDVKRMRDDQSFKLGRTTYRSMEMVRFPVRVRTDLGGLKDLEVTANIINSDEVNFLCGENTLMDRSAMIYFGKMKLKFEDRNKVALIKGTHLAIKMEPVRRRQEGKPALTKNHGRAGHVKILGPKTFTSASFLRTLFTKDPPPGEIKSSHSFNDQEFRGTLPLRVILRWRPGLQNRVQKEDLDLQPTSQYWFKKK